MVAGVQVRITETTRQDISLEVGKIEETVNVEAAPSLINPSSAQTGQALDSQTLNDAAVGLAKLPVPAFAFFRCFRRTNGRSHGGSRNSGR